MDSIAAVDGRDRRRAARARASSRGASRWPRRSGRRSATRTTGAGPCPGSATRAHTSSSSAWRRPRTARNRTGRMFTGDRSGDWLYGALHRAGFANQPTIDKPRRRTSAHRRVHHRRRALRAARPTSRRSRSATRAGRSSSASSRCSRDAACSSRSARSRYEALCRVFGVRPRPRFGHGVEVSIEGGRTILCSFHPSQQNTFTGKLTATMLDAVFTRAVELAADGQRSALLGNAKHRLSSERAGADRSEAESGDVDLRRGRRSRRPRRSPRARRGRGRPSCATSGRSPRASALRRCGPRG